MTFISSQFKGELFGHKMDRLTASVPKNENTARVEQAVDQLYAMTAHRPTPRSVTGRDLVLPLSSQERNVILDLTHRLTRDGDMSKADADTIINAMNQLSEGSLSGLNAFQRAWPFPEVDFGKLQGNPMFNGIVGLMSSIINKDSTTLGSRPIDCGIMPIIGCIPGPKPPITIDSVPGSIIEQPSDAVFLSTVNQLLDSAKGFFGDNPWSGALRGAINNADLSKLDTQERNELVAMLSVAVADRGVNFPEASVILDKLKMNLLEKEIQPTVPEWKVEQKEDGTGTIDIGTHTINLNENKSEIVVINKETGEKSRIWGDPHFDTNGDGKTDVDFWGTISLNLEGGTKITIQTTPYEKNNKETLSSRLVITNGDKAIEVNGLDQNKKGDLTIKTSEDGRYKDALVGDGLKLYENKKGQGWLIKDGFHMRQVNQDDMNEAKKSTTDFSPKEAVSALIAQLSKLNAASSPLANILNTMLQRLD